MNITIIMNVIFGGLHTNCSVAKPADHRHKHHVAVTQFARVFVFILIIYLLNPVDIFEFIPTNNLSNV